MSRSKRAHIASGSLSELIERFSQHDVIAEMEKEYQSTPTRLIPTSLIDDTEILSSVEIKEKTVQYFAEGLKEKGLYNPLVVRVQGDRYEVVLGRKRFFGAKRAGLVSLPCVVLDIGDEEQLLMLLADARDQRDNNILEMALVCRELERKFNYPQKTLAVISHQSRSQITNILRVLKLPKQLQKELAKGNLSYGHAKSIAGLNSKEMLEVGNYVLEHHLSVHQLEEYLRKKNHPTTNPHLKKIVIGSDSITIRFADKVEKEAILKALEKYKK